MREKKEKEQENSAKNKNCVSVSSVCPLHYTRNSVLIAAATAVATTKTKTTKTYNTTIVIN
jgi:hypothetical protein